jgi:NAD(P)-dependent dehydrogenase (short-subunit alcohol dehydrogenase family)
MGSRPVALVTGAARRIGRAIALDLARHGWDLAVHYRSSAEAALGTAADARALGAEAKPFQADLADETAARALVPAVVARFGRIDAVVNNASMFEYDDAAGFSYAKMAAHLAANTAPAIVLANALAAELRGSSATGCVVNLLDQRLANPNPDYFSYTLSKAALQSATTMLAMALAPRVRVCAVAPGLTLTSPMIDAARLKKLKAAGPLQHGVEAPDIAHAVRFLLENPAVTGVTLLVDAGSHLVPMTRDFAFIPVLDDDLPTTGSGPVTLR